MLRRLGYLESSYPADKIFGILGLCKFPSTPIMPDYAKSTGKVFSQAMAHIIMDTDDGFIYGYPKWPVGLECSDCADFELPSWVPDFSRGSYWLNKEPRALGGLRRVCDQGNLLEVTKTAARCFPFARFTNEYQTLHAGGLDIGTVCASWEMWKPGQHPKQERLFMVIDEAQKKGASREALLSAFMGVDSSSNLESGARQDQEHRSGKIDQGPWSDDNIGLIQAASDSPARFLFLTETGQIGVTGSSVKKGDLLAGLFGINFPVLLRWNDQKESYGMVNVAHVASHEWGHKAVPNNITEEDLLGNWGFSLYVIN